MIIAEALTIRTPDGPFSFVATDQAILASGWTEDLSALARLVSVSLRPAAVRATAPENAETVGGFMGEARAAVQAYYNGELTAPGEVPVIQQAAAFRLKVWDVLRTIQPGDYLTYLDLASRTGNPGAVRAVGSACAFNAAALFVPCHRVVRSDGTLGGYRYGLAIKEGLLTRENAATRN